VLPTVFVFDTSAFSQLRSYFPNQFPSFWKQIDSLVDAGGITSVRDVRKEFDRRPQSEWLEAWLKKHSTIFQVPGPDETAFVAEIFKVKHFQALVGQQQRLRGEPVADPFLIAAAKVRGGCVVTQETKRPNAAKIPNVCEHFGVACTSFEGFMAQNAWSY
jgi:Domain of unknown function (DUF4411)